MISRYVDQTARGVLLISLTGMLGLSTLSIVLRWFGLSLMWIDPLVRHLVLVAAFGGGVLAVAKNNHIRIDVLAKPLEKAPLVWRKVVERILTVATAIATTGLAWSAWQFFVMEKEYGAEALLGLHSSTLVLIFPIGWGLLAVRWFLAFVDSWK